MSASPGLCQNPCETCVKQGLPLLLTRYAVLPDEARAPQLGGTLPAEDLAKVPLTGKARYGLRLLRSGYLYAFDEVRNHWDEYFVTQNGYLTKLPVRIRAVRNRPAPAVDFACASNGHAPLAGVITVRNPKHATKVWLAFSPAEWTDRVFAAHLDAAYRAKHMQCVSISGGKVAPQAQTAPLTEVGKWVPEFALEASRAVKHFDGWCPFPFNSRIANLDSFNKAVEAARPQGGAAIVALHDPSALAEELAALMEVRKQAFMNAPALVQPLHASGSIASLEFSLREQAKAAEIAAGEMLARRSEEGPESYNPNPALFGCGGDAAAAAMWRDIKPAQLGRVADAKWREYTHKQGATRFNDAARKAWQASFDESLQRFDAELIAPLARAHVAWLKSPCMVSAMTCNFDPQHPKNGVAFTDTVTRMLATTGDKQPCHDLYVQWLKDGKATAQNLLMRALALNQDQLAEAVDNVDAAPLDARAFPSDAVIGAFKETLAHLPANLQARLGALLQGVNGAALSYWNQFHVGTAGPGAAAALAGVSGKQFVRVPVVGTRGKFVQAYVQALYELDPTLKAKHNQLGKAVAAQVRLLEIEGLPMTNSQTRGWYVLLDKSALSSASRTALEGNALAQEVARAVKRPEDLRKLDMQAWKATVSGGGVQLTGGMLAGLLQAFNLTKLSSDYANAMRNDAVDAKRRLIAGSMAFAGTVGETGATAVLRLGGESLAQTRVGRILEAIKFGARRLGLGAGLFVGVLDLFKGFEEGQRKNTGLAVAYFTTGLLGAGVSVALYFAAHLGPVGWVVVALALLALIVITVLIEKNKENKVQEWLARCFFGAGAEKYPDLKTEQEELKLAFA